MRQKLGLFAVLTAERDAALAKAAMWDGIQRGTYDAMTAEVERLRALIKTGSDQVEKIAFSMPPPNSYTPQLVMVAQAMRREVHQQQAVKSEEGK